jgi:chromosomal replication initiation ATPase DnaA
MNYNSLLKCLTNPPQNPKVNPSKLRETINSKIDIIESEMNYVNQLLSIAETKSKEDLDEGIKQTVHRICEYFHVNVKDVYKKGRIDHQCTKARRLISYVLDTMSPISRVKIGKLYGHGWDATSVSQHISKIEADLYIYKHHNKDPNGTIKHFHDLNIPLP